MSERVTAGALLKQLFWASRPISWINTAYPFGAAYLVSTHRLDATFWIGSLFFLIPYNLLMYGANDVFDYESDLRNPRKGSIEGAVLAPKWHRPTLLAAFLLPLPFLAYLFVAGNLQSAATLVVLLFAVVAYSVKGMRFKEVPILDSFTSATHFVGPMAVGLAFAGVPLNGPVPLRLMGAFLLWGMASHAFGAVQDIRADRDGGLSSVATVLGAKLTVQLALLAYGEAGLLLIQGGWPMMVGAIAVIPYVVILWPFHSLADDDCELANAGWRRFIWLNFFAGFVVTMLLILISMKIL